MPIPQSRQELTELLTTSYNKLQTELMKVDGEGAELPCVDDWSIKNLLAVRLWWTESVVEWIETGRRGGSPVTPAPGYGWKETPRLNADLVKASRDTPWPTLCTRLDRGYQRVLALIAELDDRELLQAGVFPWAGKWPVSRWISINTARQYTTARTLLSRALRRHSC